MDKLNLFIEKANRIHGNKYNYDKVVYVNCNTKICIVCPIHGEFWQKPKDHLQGKGCKKCGIEKSRKCNTVYNTELFIKKCQEKFNYDYDFSQTSYTSSHEKVTCICHKHGEFEQYAYLLLQGHGCPTCGKKSGKKRKTNEEFLKQANLIHEQKYTYIDKYETNRKKIRIQCNRCGRIFMMTPFSHITDKQGCSVCNRIEGNKNKLLGVDEFIKKSKEIHGDKYDYENVDYINSHTKVEIKCRKCNKIFYQSPSKHMIGQGCPSCNMSHLESEIKNKLSDENIRFNQQQRFNWLGKQSLDFYLPEYNIAIECQGEQHFRPIKFFGGIERFNYVCKLDEQKKILCEENGVKLLYYSHDDDINEFMCKIKR